MIDGINGGGGPIRSPFTARNQPAGDTAASDPGKPVRRIAPAVAVSGSIGNSGLIKDMASAPPVNSARVAQLQAAIAAGRYPIDADAIAGAMLALDRGRR
jgi:negative regulator of flagellin synthesis FlgM